MKFLTYFIIFLGALPLPIYPAVVVADIMGLFTNVPELHMGIKGMLLTLPVRLFCLGTLVYPIVYLLCTVLAISQSIRNRKKAALYFGVTPLIYMLLLLALIAICVVIGDIMAATGIS